MNTPQISPEEIPNQHGLAKSVRWLGSIWLAQVVCGLAWIGCAWAIGTPPRFIFEIELFITGLLDLSFVLMFCFAVSQWKEKGWISGFIQRILEFGLFLLLCAGTITIWWLYSEDYRQRTTEWLWGWLITGYTTFVALAFLGVLWTRRWWTTQNVGGWYATYSIFGAVVVGWSFTFVLPGVVIPVLLVCKATGFAPLWFAPKSYDIVMFGIPVAVHLALVVAIVRRIWNPKQTRQ